MIKFIHPIYIRAFTLMELMVAIVVLLGIMVAVGRILSTTSTVASIGGARAEMSQQVIAIEQQLRQDIERISNEGFFAIHSVAVANNISGDTWLIDNARPPEAIIRCDQMIFFINGVESSTLNTGTTNYAGQGTASMLYYGHGLRFPQLIGMRDSDDDGEADVSDDPILNRNNIEGVITPWYEGTIEVETRKYPEANEERFDIVGTTYTANGTQPSPDEWVLCRQIVVLGDDDPEPPWADSKKTYMNTGVASNTIFPWDPRIPNPPPYDDEGNGPTFPQLMHGRVDLAATQLDDIRQSVLQHVESNGLPREWRLPNSLIIDQQELIGSLFRWPRVEPFPPTTNRYDQIMMMHALAEGCVSFKIEWTYDEGLGEQMDAAMNWYPGIAYADNWPQPWWGDANRVDPTDSSNLEISFETFLEYSNNAIGIADDWDLYPNKHDDEDTDISSLLINAKVIEANFGLAEGHYLAPVPRIDQLGVSEYWAIFGYNTNEPFAEDGVTLLSNNPNLSWQYTPRPSALRITLEMLDRRDRLGGAKIYQFIVYLPE
mgnify:CR=1 FL=1